LLSVIIVNYNAGDLLFGCVEMVLASSKVKQVIVVDNASRDDSFKRVRRLAGDQRLQLIENQKNLGFSRANNMAMEKLRTESRYILFLNPDCEMSEGVAGRLLDFMENNEDVGMSTCLVANPDGSEQRGCRRHIPDLGNTLAALFPWSKTACRHDFNLSETPLPSAPVEVEAISGSFMFVRRTVIEAIGGFDEGYFLHCEDLDLCKRIGLAGWKIMFVPDVRIVHHQGVCSQARPLKVSWHKHCGMRRFFHKFYRKHYGFPLSLLVTAAIWFHFVLEIPQKLLVDRS